MVSLSPVNRQYCQRYCTFNVELGKDMPMQLSKANLQENYSQCKCLWPVMKGLWPVIMARAYGQ